MSNANLQTRTIDPKRNPDIRPQVRVEYDFDAIPNAFRQLDNWVLWKYEFKNGRWTKVPYQTNNRNADSTKPKTWTSFNDAVIAYGRGGFDGIGFAIGDSGLTCVDVDHISEWDHEEPLRQIKEHAYCELSPSGDGQHLWVHAQKPNGNCKSDDFHKGFVEVYNSVRYITMTGAGREGSITSCQAQFDATFKNLFFPPNENPQGNLSQLLRGNGDSVTKQAMPDSEIISRIGNENSQGSSDWIRLNSFGYAKGEDQSGCDLSFVNKVAFYTKDYQQIERIWLSSAIGQRSKIQNRKDYRERTINKAIADTANHAPNLQTSETVRTVETIKAMDEGDNQYFHDEAVKMVESIKVHPSLNGADNEDRISIAMRALYEFGRQFSCNEAAKQVYDHYEKTTWRTGQGWNPNSYFEHIAKDPDAAVNISEFTELTPSPFTGKSFKLNLREEVPEKEFLFGEYSIPRGEVSIMSGANGSGKSQLACQIVIQACTGKSIMWDGDLGYPFSIDNRVKYRALIVTFEDDRQQYARRLRNVITKYPSSGLNIHQAFDDMDNNLDVVDTGELFGTDNLLSHYVTGTKTVEATPNYHHLKRFIKQGDYDLVILDPWHYSTAAEENDNNSQGQHTMIIRQLARDCDCAVLAFAHTSDANPSRVRGATSVMDRARQGWMFASLSKLYQHHHSMKHLPFPTVDQLPDGIHHNDVSWLYMSKNSYGPKKQDYTLFKRINDGLLVPFKAKGTDQTLSDEQKIMAYIDECQDQEATQSMIVDGLDVAKSTIQRKVSAMADRGELVESRKVGRTVFYKVA
jgi:putative DNA primase/helicase